MTMPDPPGRQVVAPGEIIGSDWGNAAWEQTVNRFDSAGDRDAQWADPPDGALVYTAAEQTYWLRRAGHWLPLVAAARGQEIVLTDDQGGFVIPYGVTFPSTPIVLVTLADHNGVVGAPMPIPYVWSPGTTASQFTGGVRDYMSNPLTGNYRINWEALL